MSSYTSVKFNLGKTQQAKIKRALKGGSSCTLRVSAASIGAGDHKLSCTETQIKRLKKKKSAGVGMQVVFSHPSLRHAVKQGGSFLGSVVGGVGHFGVDLLANACGGKLKKKVKAEPKTKGKGIISKIARKAVHYGVDAIGDLIDGAGFFEDLGKPINFAGGKLKSTKKASKTTKGKGLRRKTSGKGMFAAGCS